jgi:hypothetical protein
MRNSEPHQDLFGNITIAVAAYLALLVFGALVGWIVAFVVQP